MKHQFVVSFVVPLLCLTLTQVSSFAIEPETGWSTTISCQNLLGGSTGSPSEEEIVRAYWFILTEAPTEPLTGEQLAALSDDVFVLANSGHSQHGLVRRGLATLKVVCERQGAAFLERIRARLHFELQNLIARGASAKADRRRVEDSVSEALGPMMPRSRIMTQGVTFPVVGNKWEGTGDRFYALDPDNLPIFRSSPDGEWVASLTSSGGIEVYRSRGGKLVQAFLEPIRAIHDIAFFHREPKVATSCNDGSLQIRSASSQA
jgi:hypothetical protein